VEPHTDSGGHYYNCCGYCLECLYFHLTSEKLRLADWGRGSSYKVAHWKEVLEEVMWEQQGVVEAMVCPIYSLQCSFGPRWI